MTPARQPDERPSSEQPLDRRWMRRALALARRGEALAHPNPMVGAVVVRGGRVVGEGFHTYDGVRHAEVLAIERAGERARGATLYLNLEPCCHQGRTGPCTEAILAAGIGRVVAAMADPNPLVAGKGFRKLRRAGIDVQVGPSQTEARRLNEPFAAWIRRRRPLVTLKAAATLDGKISLVEPGAGRRPPRAVERWITSEISRRRVQQLRHASDAVLTGVGTVFADNPLLTDRSGRPRRRPLLRVVLDSQLRLPLGSKLVRSAADDLLVFTLRSPRSAPARKLAERGVQVMRVPARNGRPDLAAVLAALGQREILSLLVEAGAEVNGAMLARNLIDKVLLFYSPRILARPGMPLALAFEPSRHLPATMTGVELRRSGPDILLEGYLQDVYRDH
ncbi:MAG TPA: bifunctional diaminohydroxyphosphoribosylaminopyrimidine deaminase/5-amino-6-(5-phosphoribosylamino)uracil reductase RibD [Candidatus Dormibacteraeota bacterium]|nr:bifunctional diaminohydroxyphosphoribosylaminopyrimidine deaminase/5-amino-6-(5-phosphoribosylamino)uracil reductase RibD [Candidatus Dormibacteraeota bacterium]